MPHLINSEDELLCVHALTHLYKHIQRKYRTFTSMTPQSIGHIVKNYIKVITVLHVKSYIDIAITVRMILIPL